MNSSNAVKAAERRYIEAARQRGTLSDALEKSQKALTLMKINWGPQSNGAHFQRLNAETKTLESRLQQARGVFHNALNNLTQADNTLKAQRGGKQSPRKAVKRKPAQKTKVVTKKKRIRA